MPWLAIGSANGDGPGMTRGEGGRVREVQGGGQWRAILRWLIFPFTVLAGTTVLVALRISGSSIGALAAPGYRTGLLLGTARGVRSDEFQLTTPSNVSSVLQGFPSNPWVGLAPTNLDVAVHSGISIDWTAIFHPDHWGYILLGTERGLAFSWWWPFTVCLLGTFALTGFVVRSAGLASAFAVLATFTPYSAWWSAAPPAMVLGYGAALGACLLGAAAAKRVISTVGLGLLGAFLAVCFTLVLYPPWAISVAIVVAAVVVGRMIDLRLSWIRWGIVVGAIGVVSGAILAVWYVQNTAAIKAMTDTYYPGHRITVPGTGWAYQFFSAPLNFWMAGPAGATVGRVAGAPTTDNLSENAASWLPLAALVLLAALGLGPAVRRLANRVRGHRAVAVADAGDRTSSWTLGLVTGALVLLIAWFFLPVPDLIGALTFLDRVQPGRLPLAMGFAAAMIGATVAGGLGHQLRWVLGGGLVAAALDGLSALWAMTAVPWDWSTVSPVLVFLSGLVLSAGFVLLASRRLRTFAAVGLAIYAFASWALVNPVQQGLGPLKYDPMVRTLKAVAHSSPNKRIMVFAGSDVVALARGAGLQSVSGQTPIPDAGVMNRLAPADELLWNNYVKYDWQPAPAGAKPVIIPQRGSSLILRIDPCSSELREAVAPQWALSAQPLKGYECLLRTKVLHRDGGTRYYLYRVQD